MDKFLEIQTHKSLLHQLFNARRASNRICLASDDDLRNQNLTNQITNRAAGRKIESVIFDSLNDEAHLQLPPGAGYFEGQNYAWVCVNIKENSVRVIISSHNLVNVIVALDRIKNGETPDFWRPDYGYRIPGSVSCAFGNEPDTQLRNQSPNFNVDYDWWGPHI